MYSIGSTLKRILSASFSSQFSGHPSRVPSVRLSGLHLFHQRPVGNPSAHQRGQEEPR